MKIDSELFSTITNHLMMDVKPSDYLNEIFDSEEFKQQPYSMLRRLKETEQSKLHHPEGNVWNHTVLVLDEAAKVRDKSSNPKAFMWAALLHDIGKPDTTRIKGEKVTAYNHDNIGADLSKQFLQAVIDNQDFIMEVYHLVKYHMHMLYILKRLPFGDNNGLISSVDIQDIALLGFCDRLGRTGVKRDEVREDYLKFYSTLEALKKETLSIH